MKYFFLILIGITVASCKPQIKADLLALKFDDDVSNLVQADQQLKKDQDPNLGLVAYATVKPADYAVGGIQLSTYSYPNGNLADHNQLYLFVAGATSNNYLGFNYCSVDQEETKSMIAYLKKTYPSYEQRSQKETGESFFMDVPKFNAWIFVYQQNSNDQSGKHFLTTNFIYVKKGTRMENSTDPKVITIKDYYDMMYPIGAK